MMGDVTWSWSMGVMSIPLPLSMYVVAHSLHVNACFAIGSYHLMNQTQQWALWWKYGLNSNKLIFLLFFRTTLQFISLAML